MDAQLMSALASREGRSLFPALQTVSMTFAEEGWGWTQPFLSGIWNTLLSALEARDEGGNRLRSLVLVGTQPKEIDLRKEDGRWMEKARLHVEEILDERMLC